MTPGIDSRPIQLSVAAIRIETTCTKVLNSVSFRQILFAFKSCFRVKVTKFKRRWTVFILILAVAKNILGG